MKARLPSMEEHEVSKMGYREFFKAHLKLNCAEDSQRIENILDDAAKRTDEEEFPIMTVLNCFDEIFWQGASRELFGDDPTPKELRKAIRALGEYARQKSIRLNKLNKRLKRQSQKWEDRDNAS